MFKVFKQVFVGIPFLVNLTHISLSYPFFAISSWCLCVWLPAPCWFLLLRMFHVWSLAQTASWPVLKLGHIYSFFKSQCFVFKSFFRVSLLLVSYSHLLHWNFSWHWFWCSLYRLLPSLRPTFSIWPFLTNLLRLILFSIILFWWQIIFLAPWCLCLDPVLMLVLHLLQ